MANEIMLAHLEDDDGAPQAGLGPLNYDLLPGLEDVCLEESFVREIVLTASSLRFVLLAALRSGHPYYARPESNERHCFLPATLTFPDAQATWSRREERRFEDARGAVDLGNIDMLVALAEGGYRVEGDWGSIHVARSRAPVFTVVGASPPLRSYQRDALRAWVAGENAQRHHHHHDDPHDHDHGGHEPPPVSRQPNHGNDSQRGR